LAGKFDARSVLLAILVSIWALRLGSFLFLRIRQPGVDERFDAIKPSFTRFLMAWTLQGLWVFLTLAAALAAMTSAPLGLIGFVGTAIWVAGFAIEVKFLAEERWGNDPDFNANARKTPVLFPHPSR